LELSGERGIGIVFLRAVQLPGTGRALRGASRRFAAPSFSIFKYISTYEDDVTEIIRDLLDPHGDHGQGTLFLQAFLAQLELGFPGLESDLVRATFRTQARTAFDRRLDLLIDSNAEVLHFG
jgi:hypothetical protein